MTLTLTADFAREFPARQSAETITGSGLVYTLASSALVARETSWSADLRNRWIRRSSPLDQRLEALFYLPANWDSYGAEPIRPLVLERVRSLVASLMEQGVPMPDIVPSSSGAIVMEWRRPGLEIEIELDPDGEDMVRVETDGLGLGLDFEGAIDRLAGESRDILQEALSHFAAST